MSDHKEKLLSKWPREATADGDRVATFEARFQTVQKLREFYDDTRNVAWPETSGESPWGFASMVAHLVFANEARVPDHFHEPWRSDLVRAIEGLENRHILAGERADIFMNAFFRAVANNLQDRPLQFTSFKFDGFNFRDVCFIAVLRMEGDNPLDGEFVLYRAHYLPTQQHPIGVYSVRDIIKPPALRPDLRELGRIFRFGNGRDGYQWGDTRGAEGNYGAETLACLTLLGYARRTGADARNALGGSWPEVEVTPAGMLALMRSGVLMKVQREMEAEEQEVRLMAPRCKLAIPVATIASGAWGDMTFCTRTGAVLGLHVAPDCRMDDIPVRIDVAELAKAYPDEEIAGQTFDILDLGYWTADGRHEEPEEDFREELRHCRAAP